MAKGPIYPCRLVSSPKPSGQLVLRRRRCTMTRESHHLLDRKALKMEPGCLNEMWNNSKHIDKHVSILQRFCLAELVVKVKFPPTRCKTRPQQCAKYSKIPR